MGSFTGSRRGARRALAGSLLAVAVVVPLACGDDDETATTTTASEATTTETSEPATATTGTTGAPTTAEQALAGFEFGEGTPYAGDCAATVLEEDVGAWCSTLTDDRGTTRIYAAGPTFSEYTTWILLAEGPEGWAVEDSAGAGTLDDPEPAPW